MTLLELHGVSKRYGGVLANDDISLALAPGEIHAVLGENGAGKSTLMRLVGGAVAPDGGRMSWLGRPYAPRSPAQARAMGVFTVHQHFALFDRLTVAENVRLALPAAARREAGAERLLQAAREHGLALDPDRIVGSLSVGERQRVELLRILMLRPRLLILDEPTSVLDPRARDALFATLRGLADQGCSMLYISHKLDEISRLCDRCTVLRQGRVVACVTPRDADAAALAALMLGPDAAVRAPSPGEPMRPPADVPQTDGVLLEVRGVSAPGVGGRPPLSALSLSLRAGEILGIGGVSGSGQGALLDALAGEAGVQPAGTVTLAGRDVSALDVATRRRLGLRYVPEERLGRACVPALDLAANVCLTHDAVFRSGWLDWGRARRRAADLLQRHGVRAASGAFTRAASLSGGNLQKFVVGRELDGAPRVLLVAQPTWGVDVCARAHLHRALRALCDNGGAVLMVTEDIEELLVLSDRVAVMAAGRLSPVRAVAEVDAGWLGRAMAGGADEEDSDVAA